MSYTPFFYLCERDKNFKKNTENYPKMVRMLIEQVDAEKDPQCFKHDTYKGIHWADFEYVHDLTGYTCLHWMAFSNDFESIRYIINHIDDDPKVDKKQTFIRLLQRTKKSHMTPMCIAGSKQ